ncbi:hypothetical protein [Streptomyces tritici]|uniref:hypothetical protein n=1 Tax=Streptomyces tritici TaxID=2054410 RepID=UPI003AF0E423
MTGAGGTARPSLLASAGVVTALAVLLAGCSTGGTGSRDEGAARADSSAPSSVDSPAPSAGAGYATDRPDPIELLKADPKLGARVKESLKPCAADAYPVDTSYGNVTGGSGPDVVVNVMTCGDAVGIGTYVYRRAAADKEYQNVFMAEDAAVYATIDRGDLIVTKQIYAKGDPVAYPSGEDVLTYRWTGNKFVQTDWVHNEYSKAVGDGGIDGPATAAPSN